MRFDIITLFPELFQAFTEHGVNGRAIQQGLVSFWLWNPRDYTQNSRRTVDDRPYGGGPGMLMKVEPLGAAIRAATAIAPNSQVVYLSPQGRLLNQADVKMLAARTGMILIAGRYEGVDERLLQIYVDEEWSIGDYVLSGGELAALVLMDAIIRLLPGVLGHADSADQDSHSNGLLDYPHYTRPAETEGLHVPEVLLSGNHQAIHRWRLQQSLGRTWLKRPDLLAKRSLSNEEQQLLDAFVSTYIAKPQ